jgi:hypothetical protein
LLTSRLLTAILVVDEQIANRNSAMSQTRGTLREHPRDVARVEFFLTRALVIARVLKWNAGRGLSGNEEGSTS